MYLFNVCTGGVVSKPEPTVSGWTGVHLDPATRKFKSEPETKTEFRVGDKVKCISHDDHWVKKSKLKIGEVYEIERVRSDGHVYIKHTPDGYVLDADCFELHKEETNPQPKFPWGEVSHVTGKFKKKLRAVAELRLPSEGTSTPLKGYIDINALTDEYLRSLRANIKVKLRKGGYADSTITFYTYIEDVIDWHFAKSKTLQFDRDNVNWDNYPKWAIDAVAMAEEDHIPAARLDAFNEEDDSEYVHVSSFTDEELEVRLSEFLVSANDNSTHPEHAEYCRFAYQVVHRYLRS